MSTEYTFVSGKKKEEAKRLAQVLTDIQKHSNSALSEAENEIPLMADTIEDVRIQLRKALQNCEPWYMDEKDNIGVFHSRGFSWAAYNGYQSLEDVQDFLTSHPGYHIEDKYGTVVSLENFTKLVSGNECAIRLPSEASGK